MVTIYPTEDGKVYRGQPTYNYGISDPIGAYTLAGSIDMINYFQWDISTINVATLTSASFYWHTEWEWVDTSPANIKYTLNRLTSTFDEGTRDGYPDTSGVLNWNTQPTITTSNNVTLEHLFDGSPNWYSVDILAAMQDETGNTFGLQQYLNTPSSQAIVNSKESSSYKPYIIYTGGGPLTKTKINISDSWKDVTAMKINIGDAWKDVVGVQQNIGDTWKTVF